MWLRPFRDLVYTMPPYVSTDDDVDRLLGGIGRGGEGRMIPARWSAWLAEQAAAREERGACARRLRAARRGRPDARPGLQRLPRPLPRPGRVDAAADAALAWGGGAGRRGWSPAPSPCTASSRPRSPTTGQPARWCSRPGTPPTSPWSPRWASAGRTVLSDAHIHASLLDAARLSRARADRRPAQRRRRRTPRRSSAGADGATGALVLAESIYSVLGDAAPLAELAAAVRDARRPARRRRGARHRRRTVAGPGAPAGLAGAPHVVVTATLSKSLGAQGGAVLGTPALREHLVNRARPFIFDTALAPAATAAALAALRVLRARPELSDLVRDRVRTTWPTPSGGRRLHGAVLSIPMPSPQAAVAAQAAACGAGRPGGLLPAAVRARRHLPAAGHGERRHRRRGLGARGRRARHHRQGAPVTRRRVVVVTGTDTGVGKTIATAALAATAAGDVVVVKPVQTGIAEDADRDVRVVERLTGRPVQEFTALDEPLAPDTAARRQGVPIPPVAEHVDRILALSEQHDTVLVEGAGGLLVRLDTDGGTLLDLAAALAQDCPTASGSRSWWSSRRARHPQPHRAHRRRAPGARAGAGRARDRVLAGRARGWPSGATGRTCRG